VDKLFDTAAGRLLDNLAWYMTPTQNRGHLTPAADMEDSPYHTIAAATFYSTRYWMK